VNGIGFTAIYVILTHMLSDIINIYNAKKLDSVHQTYVGCRNR